MNSPTLEHINFTVEDPDHTAKQLTKIFDWQVRWAGAALDEGRTVHVGTPGQGSNYLALYTHPQALSNRGRNHKSIANLNHIGIAVADLDEIEQRVVALGIKTFNHANYEPGRRFYFYIDDGIEIEAVSYS